jgi:hypothetical protein
MYALGIRSEGNALKNGEPTVGISFTTMLQLTNRFTIVIQSQKKKIPENIVNRYNQNYHTEIKCSCNENRKVVVPKSEIIFMPHST